MNHISNGFGTETEPLCLHLNYITSEKLCLQFTKNQKEHFFFIQLIHEYWKLPECERSWSNCFICFRILVL